MCLVGKFSVLGVAPVQYLLTYLVQIGCPRVLLRYRPNVLHLEAAELNGLGRTYVACLEARNTLRATILLSTLPYPAKKPLDSPLVCPTQEWLDLLEGFVGRI